MNRNLVGSIYGRSTIQQLTLPLARWAKKGEGVLVTAYQVFFTDQLKTRYINSSDHTSQIYVIQLIYAPRLRFKCGLLCLFFVFSQPDVVNITWITAHIHRSIVDKIEPTSKDVEMVKKYLIIHVILTTSGWEKQTTKNKHRKPHWKKGSQKRRREAYIMKNVK
jgi:hypothetical protein